MKVDEPSIHNGTVERTAHPLSLCLVWINNKRAAPQLNIVQNFSSLSIALAKKVLESPNAIEGNHCAHAICNKGNAAVLKEL
jgi:hypothetical protein